MAKKRICLDPGHSGTKYNAGAVLGYYESETVWKLTMYEKEILEEMGIEVVLTRTGINDDPDLFTRGMTAKGCDLFVSNHTDACGTPSVDRVSGIYLVGRNDTEIDNSSKTFAGKIAPVVKRTMGVSAYKTFSKLSDRDKDGNGKLDDNYYGVLNGAFSAGVPGIILEHSFHTCAKTCTWLMNEANLKKLAKACAECMAEFVGVGKEIKMEEEVLATNASFVKKGYVVSIKKGATYYNGKDVPSWVEKKQWIVKDVAGDRAVIDKSVDGKNAINSPINTKFLTVVKATSTSSKKNTKEVKASASATKFDGGLAGTYTTTAYLNLRDGAGTRYKSLFVVPSRTKVNCYGYYTPVAGVNWLLVQVSLNGVKYTGFVCSSYLKR